MNPAIFEMLPALLHGRFGRVLHAFGDQVTVKLGGEDTAGAFALCEVVTQPGGGPPLHCHLNEDELFILQEGRVSFFIEGKWTELESKGIAFAPRGLTHTFKNSGDTPSKMWVMTTPAGFEKFFARPNTGSSL
jgi:mannose-6-phosphate isomerase-like protein (cupin superfamily)